MEPPDRSELWIRFGCGAMFGSALAALVLLYLGCLPWPWWLVVTILIMSWCGYGARKRGDEFWSLSDRWWWLDWWWELELVTAVCLIVLAWLLR